jgi:hypothetical protein
MRDFSPDPDTLNLVLACSLPRSSPGIETCHVVSVELADQQCARHERRMVLNGEVNDPAAYRCLFESLACSISRPVQHIVQRLC